MSINLRNRELKCGRLRGIFTIIDILNWYLVVHSVNVCKQIGLQKRSGFEENYFRQKMYYMEHQKLTPYPHSGRPPLEFILQVLTKSCV